MSMFDRPEYLRTVLLVDAAACFATGALLTGGTALLSSMTQIAGNVLWAAGLSLFPVASFIAIVTIRCSPIPAGVGLIILGKVGWVIGSILLLLAGGIAPNAGGVAFIILLAAAAAILGDLEFMGLRNMPAHA